MDLAAQRDDGFYSMNMERRIQNCCSIDELNELIGLGLDDASYRQAVNRLFELVTEGEDLSADDIPTTATDSHVGDIYAPTPSNIVDEIATTEHIDRLNAIIDQDNWQTNISHLAFQRILTLAGVDELFWNIIPDTPEYEGEYNETGNVIRDDDNDEQDDSMENMHGGDIMPMDAGVDEVSIL